MVGVYPEAEQPVDYVHKRVLCVTVPGKIETKGLFIPERTPMKGHRKNSNSFSS